MVFMTFPTVAPPCAAAVSPGPHRGCPNLIPFAPMGGRDGGPGMATVILTSMVTAAMVSVGLIYAQAQGWIAFSPAVEDEEVPELVGLTVDAARGVLDARGLRLVHRGDRHHEDVAPGAIASQQPRAPSRVTRGSEVTVVVSLGPAPVEVPDLTGLSLEAARLRLDEAGLTISADAREGGTGEPGTVTATIPGPGQRVTRGAEIVLVRVPSARMIPVPNVVGR